MKTRFVTGLFVVGVAFQALAQRVENDDIYFRKKDREMVKNQEALAPADSYSTPRKKNKEKENVAEQPEVVNPTDSYSAENINPEYVSRANSEKAAEEESYFTESYSPNSYGSSNFNNYNSPYGNSWNSSLAFNNAWLASPYGWNDPFFYSPYGYNPWMSSPYTGGFGYGSGWSLSMSYYWGNSWGSGWNYGLTYGWGNPYYNYYSPFYSPYFYNSWGNPYYGGGYYYGDGNSVANYGRRPSRNSALVIPTKRIISSNTEGGRVRTTTTSDVYYIKPSRRPLTFDAFDLAPQERSENSNTRIRNTNQNNNSIPSFSAPSRNNSGGGSRPASAPSRGGGGGGRSRGN
jgi:hypothetical protein